LIEYESFGEAKNALNAMNGKEINGQKINVSWGFVKGPTNNGKKHSNRRSRSRSRERR
jgi:RNA recognition motif-containing protein